jgi:hypothetical protein
MNLEASLIFFPTPLSLPQKIESDTSRRLEKKPLHVTILQCNIWLLDPSERSLNPGKSVRKYGYRQRTSSPPSLPRSLPLSDMALSQLKPFFPLSHSRSNSLPPGNHILSSMLLSYRPIKKQKSMVRITPNPPLTSSMAKKNMK